MRIGLMVYDSLDTRSGGYLYDRMLVRGLTRLGHAVTPISLPGGAYPRRIARGLQLGICRHLLAGGFDVLVQDELCHPSLVLVNRRLRRQGGPTVVALIHHLLSREPRPRWQSTLLAVVERRYLASVDGFIHNSQTTRRAVAALVGGGRPEVVAYPAGNRFADLPSPETIAKRAMRTGALELLFLGMAIPRKGLLPVLKALSRVDRSCWRLSVVGNLAVDPAYVAEARRLVRRLGLSDSVRFHGFLQDHELAEVLRASHLLCMPFAYEGFGIVFLEAMAFGLPTLGSREGAAGETIRHGINGCLLAPDDLEGAAALVAGLHHDREALQRMSLAARTTYAGRPTWRESAARIDGFLRKMTGAQPQGNATDQRRGTNAAR
ncbi:MAG: glycosyltransferase family 4 protein [Desulfosarcina sp.]